MDLASILRALVKKSTQTSQPRSNGKLNDDEKKNKQSRQLNTIVLLCIILL